MVSPMSGNDEKHRSQIEIQVCPKCLSSHLRKVGALRGDMMGAMAILPPQYTCLACGWVGRLVIVRTVDVPDRDDD
ncbi:hypothetical protein AC480_04290 [miscellaneous Crenarchaeota group archaeon SMTZ1-55]|nr:MAG: hypothetical protein AC480_04290 [miscellaneous Crenarchaeota group archaeon SMTZ1-55]